MSHLEKIVALSRQRSGADKILGSVNSTALKHSAAVKAFAGWIILTRRQKAEALERELQEVAYQEDEEVPVASISDPCFAGKNHCRDLVADLWQSASVLMDGVARQAGARYLHVLQPNQYVEGSKKLTAEELRKAYKPDGGFAQAVIQGYPLLRSRGEELVRRGIDFHDLTMVFKDESRTIYRDNCCHYNSRGYELLAQEIGSRVPLPAPKVGVAAR